MRKLETREVFSEAESFLKAGSSFMRWRTSVVMPATCGVAIDVPDIERYSPPRTADMMLPPGAASSGLRVRSGVTPHDVKSEIVGFEEASVRPAWGFVMEMEWESAALMAPISASFSFFVMVTVGIVCVDSMVAT